ncbi:DUF7317 family protein [Halopelagius longus]|uniref:Uncharacterized protein family (UPF0175) n=1 Tax=Halopelagius longus TaxID=1236180 RepID=A0A1H1EHA3_9EURY|nr:UPF0175 family protein [Halopelagius longus]RDI71757.1 hypothetical protein DWB78_08475 [Halopelagius longus]SDQ88132.1 Uncharacterised protein family (UPF0175) [Halopelagius longus]
MHTHALTTAMTLYRSGTLSLSEAAARAGRSEEELLVALKQHGIPVRDDSETAVPTGSGTRVGAD